MTDIQVLYDGPVVKRADAIRNGLKKYFTGKPCKHGHVEQRRVGGGNCIECVKVHHMENHDKVTVRKKDWCNRNPEYFKIRYEENKEELREYRASYYENNADKKREYSREYYRENRDLVRASKKVYCENNRESVLASKRSYKARRKGADGNHTSGDVFKILSTQGNKCAEPTCGADLSDGYHVDHIMPLSKGGSNWPSNLQCLCPTCNMRKNAKHPIDWARENGRLL